MKIFEEFIENILKNNGINNNDKEDLKNELMDHLIMLKKDYLDKGKSEQEAIQLSIDSFGNTSFLGYNLKSNLPSKNKHTKLNIKNQLECLFFMISTYILLTIISSFNNLNIGKVSILFSAFLSVMIYSISFIYILTKVCFRENQIKSILILNITYFLCEKLIVFICNLLFTVVLNSKSTNIFESNIFLYKYSYNLNYVIISIFIILISYIITKYLPDKIRDKFKNYYDFNLLYIILFLLSLLMTLLYFVCASSPYFCYRIALYFNISKFKIIDTNILYILLNNNDNNLVIPNIGLLILSILIIKILIKFKKNGIKNILKINSHLKDYF
ncbi:hypothetical protein G8T60_12715 [Clostridium botulinum C]|uniref:permease prefix domain 1-containing protein n=1 Tax=Clostridium botulinum TaxID=1491 RepID=UPI001E364B75|nr:permease prefix domain 1-containing protein [Clostridium botulinum]MCD3206751.1 hypothetical protein [Clostridium botulinum C]MCD3209664.1 hypothetical protein [Clostridium botulinum C]MCD3226551.1 hypothetical protein [Clostridium botulinum C]MCD3248985.1 hypothetical protein [Clostridium botulinum C]MCD3257569.1 hypothetical protein [Clostridium botulinum C]